MKLKITSIILLTTLFFACNEAPSDQTTTVEETEEPTAITTDLLAKNDRIKTGEIQTKPMIKTVSCTGRIDIPPTELVSVHSKVNGQVIYLKFLPGDFVKKGALLASIQNPQLVEKQRILLETKANLDFAKKDYERKKMLKEGKATADKIFDESQNKYELLTATYNGLKQELALLGVNVDQLETGGKFQSSVNIYANESGYIHEVSVNKGQMITPETRLMEIADIDHLHLELQVLSKDIGGIEKGQSVRFFIPNRTEEFKAEVVKINPMIDEENATLQVHCHIEHPDKKAFISGMFVNAKIELGTQEMKGLPLSAVVKEGNDYFAYKLESGRAIKTALVQVQSSEDFVTFEGEKAGTWVTEGAYYVE